jgi:sulfite exporter TauE/SafE
MFNDPEILISAFLLGLLGSGHCLGMCGGLSSALGLNTPTNQVPTKSASIINPHVLAYNIGRVISYSLAGIIVGTLGFWLSKNLASLSILRYMAAMMLILMGLYLGKWFNGIMYTEKLGKLLWPLIQPLSRRFMPVKNIKDALLVGMVWGWLPCGLVYSALIWASLESSIPGSMLIMLGFGLGTLPAMLATGIFAHKFNQFIRKEWFRNTSGSMMIAFGIWSMPIVQQQVNLFFR